MNDKQNEIENEIQQNITNWQVSENPLAPLKDKQIDAIYEIRDILKAEEEQYQNNLQNESKELPEIYTNNYYYAWMTSIENKIKTGDLREYCNYSEVLNNQLNKFDDLYSSAEITSNLLQDLRTKYTQVSTKTNSLHNLSEQLMTQQRILKEHKKNLHEKLHYFINFKTMQDNVEKYSNKINSVEFIELLKSLNDAITYLGEHINFKESRIYKMKYESLLVNALNRLYRIVSNVITEAANYLLDPDSKKNILPLNANIHDSKDSTFSLYYGKFQTAASKVSTILSYLEQNSETNEQYKNIMTDCQKFYVSKRLPILSSAVANALSELKEINKKDYSTLFRSCGLFIMKICQDEANCYHYFFNNSSDELREYLGNLCQHVYDTLRPSLITINHVEVLSELCSILQKEMLTDKIKSNENLEKYVEIINQLLQDVEERLVFRTNIFFQRDLMSYNPSPGDLAYPEKLKQLEDIAIDFDEMKNDPQLTTVESKDTTANPINFRSYTGNSAADLHGMWYPTVKRTLVILSRLYFCLDKDTFQGLAQEALLICIQTVQHAANLISTRKSNIDGYLFQIKHLLIIREQIAPFQVDFTTLEVSLDFSTIQKAAVELLHNRNKIFTFNSNNALLEFLLEGTPRVREYLIDSRKEVDKQLKQCCEGFISCVTDILISDIQNWITKAEQYLFSIQNIEKPEPLPQKDFGNAKVLATIISDTIRNIKSKIPEIQKSMQLYLANRETEFILFRPVKNNIINAFVHVQQLLVSAKYSDEEVLLIGCPLPEQVNILICSVSLSNEQPQVKTK